MLGIFSIHLSILLLVNPNSVTGHEIFLHLSRHNSFLLS
nr:MAG TPA: hypothetical protein [Caudoviricetes sp.]